MGDIDEVQERLRADPGFADELIADPRQSLEPYALSVEDLRGLVDQLNGDPALGPLEQRQRRARFFQLFAERLGRERDR
jgi:hypothetical protein